MAPEQEQAYRALRDAFRNVFMSREGQVVLADLRRMCRVFKTTHLADDPGGRNSANLEGRRQVMLYIEAMRSESDDLMRVLLEPEQK